MRAAGSPPVRQRRVSDTDEPATLTPDEEARLTNHPRLRDYLAAEIFIRPRELERVRFLGWLVEHGHVKES